MRHTKIVATIGPASDAPEMLDRLLAGGVVIHGHVTLAAADIDLVQLDLAVLLASIDSVR